jgi:thymidylate synthase
MNSLDKQYTDLLQDILDNGVVKKDRTGTGTISVFGRQIRHKMSEGFPLLTTKKMAWKQIVTELLWFLRGDTNIKYLVDNNCHIWDGDCFANYIRNFSKYVDSLPENGEAEFIINKDKFINKIKTDNEFAKKWGELGPVYGRQWRSWGGKNTTLVDVGGVSKKDLDKVIEAAKNKEDVSRYGAHIKQQNNSIDQIANLIRDLKTNPDSRRLMVNAWNVGELDQMVLPPCHYGFQVYTRELSLEERCELLNPKPQAYDIVEATKEALIEQNIPTRAISLMWNQRSVDTFLGLPFNIASYGLLLEIIAKEVNMVPDELIGNLGDVHLYNNHIEQAKEQIGRLTLEERRAMVTQEQFDKIYTAGSPDSLSHSEIDQFGVPRSTREPFELPKLIINDEFWNHEHQTIDGWINGMEIGDFTLDGYQSHPTIKAPLSN